MRILAWLTLHFTFPLVLQANSILPIVDELARAYGDFAKNSGNQIEIQIDWQDFSSSGSAKIQGQKWLVVLGQGLVFHRNITADILRMTVCHELGHILGGAPRKHVPFDWDGDFAPDGLSFFSSEGQADYYASQVCFRQLVQNQDHDAMLKLNPPPSEVIRKCELAHGKESNDSKICQRAATAGEGFLKLDIHSKISFLTPDPPATKIIQDTYPNRQCRLDTFFAGAQCSDHTPLALDFYDDSENDCSQKQAERPSCWHP